MDIQEILAKAFDIGNKTSFEVDFFKENVYTGCKTMTYTELGIFLINNSKTINQIYINQTE